MISLTIYMQTKGVTYKEQALLTIAFYPFAAKV